MNLDSYKRISFIILVLFLTTLFEVQSISPKSDIRLMNTTIKQIRHQSIEKAPEEVQRNIKSLDQKIESAYRQACTTVQALLKGYSKQYLLIPIHLNRCEVIYRKDESITTVRVEIFKNLNTEVPHIEVISPGLMSTNEINEFGGKVKEVFIEWLLKKCDCKRKLKKNIKEKEANCQLFFSKEMEKHRNSLVFFERLLGKKVGGVDVEVKEYQNSDIKKAKIVILPPHFQSSIENKKFTIYIITPEKKSKDNKVKEMRGLEKAIQGFFENIDREMALFLKNKEVFREGASVLEASVKKKVMYVHPVELHKFDKQEGEGLGQRVNHLEKQVQHLENQEMVTLELFPWLYEEEATPEMDKVEDTWVYQVHEQKGKLSRHYSFFGIEELKRGTEQMGLEELQNYKGELSAEKLMSLHVSKLLDKSTEEEKVKEEGIPQTPMVPKDKNREKLEKELEKVEQTLVGEKESLEELDKQLKTKQEILGNEVQGAVDVLGKEESLWRTKNLMDQNKDILTNMIQDYKKQKASKIKELISTIDRFLYEKVITGKIDEWKQRYHLNQVHEGTFYSTELNEQEDYQEVAVWLKEGENKEKVEQLLREIDKNELRQALLAEITNDERKKHLKWSEGGGSLSNISEKVSCFSDDFEDNWSFTDEEFTDKLPVEGEVAFEELERASTMTNMLDAYIHLRLIHMEKVSISQGLLTPQEFVKEAKEQIESFLLPNQSEVREGLKVYESQREKESYKDKIDILKPILKNVGLLSSLSKDKQQEWCGVLKDLVLKEQKSRVKESFKFKSNIPQSSHEKITDFEKRGETYEIGVAVEVAVEFLFYIAVFEESNQKDEKKEQAEKQLREAQKVAERSQAEVVRSINHLAVLSKREKALRTNGQSQNKEGFQIQEKEVNRLRTWIETGDVDVWKDAFRYREKKKTPEQDLVSVMPLIPEGYQRSVTQEKLLEYEKAKEKSNVDTSSLQLPEKNNNGQLMWMNMIGQLNSLAHPPSQDTVSILDRSLQIKQLLLKNKIKKDQQEEEDVVRVLLQTYLVMKEIVLDSVREKVSESQKEWKSEQIEIEVATRMFALTQLVLVSDKYLEFIQEMLKETNFLKRERTAIVVDPIWKEKFKVKFVAESQEAVLEGFQDLGETSKDFYIESCEVLHRLYRLCHSLVKNNILKVMSLSVLKQEIQEGGIGGEDIIPYIQKTVSERKKIIDEVTKEVFELYPEDFVIKKGQSVNVSYSLHAKRRNLSKERGVVKSFGNFFHPIEKEEDEKSPRLHYNHSIKKDGKWRVFREEGELFPVSEGEKKIEEKEMVSLFLYAVKRTGTVEDVKVVHTLESAIESAGLKIEEMASFILEKYREIKESDFNYIIKRMWLFCMWYAHEFSKTKNPPTMEMLEEYFDNHYKLEDEPLLQSYKHKHSLDQAQMEHFGYILNYKRREDPDFLDKTMKKCKRVLMENKTLQEGVIIWDSISLGLDPTFLKWKESSFYPSMSNGKEFPLIQIALWMQEQYITRKVTTEELFNEIGRASERAWSSNRVTEILEAFLRAQQEYTEKQRQFSQRGISVPVFPIVSHGKLGLLMSLWWGKVGISESQVYNSIDSKGKYRLSDLIIQLEQNSKFRKYFLKDMMAYVLNYQAYFMTGAEIVETIISKFLSFVYQKASEDLGMDQLWEEFIKESGLEIQERTYRMEGYGEAFLEAIFYYDRNPSLSTDTEEIQQAIRRYLVETQTGFKKYNSWPYIMFEEGVYQGVEKKGMDKVIERGITKKTQYKKLLEKQRRENREEKIKTEEELAKLNQQLGTLKEELENVKSRSEELNIQKVVHFLNMMNQYIDLSKKEDNWNQKIKEFYIKEEINREKLEQIREEWEEESEEFSSRRMNNLKKWKERRTDIRNQKKILMSQIEQEMPEVETWLKEKRGDFINSEEEELCQIREELIKTSQWVDQYKESYFYKEEVRVKEGEGSKPRRQVKELMTKVRQLNGSQDADNIDGASLVSSESYSLDSKIPPRSPLVGEGMSIGGVSHISTSSKNSRASQRTFMSRLSGASSYSHYQVKGVRSKISRRKGGNQDVRLSKFKPLTEVPLENALTEMNSLYKMEDDLRELHQKKQGLKTQLDGEEWRRYERYYSWANRVSQGKLPVGGGDVSLQAEIRKRIKSQSLEIWEKIKEWLGQDKYISVIPIPLLFLNRLKGSKKNTIEGVMGAIQAYEEGEILGDWSQVVLWCGEEKIRKARAFILEEIERIKEEYQREEQKEGGLDTAYKEALLKLINGRVGVVAEEMHKNKVQIIKKMKELQEKSEELWKKYELAYKKYQVNVKRRVENYEVLCQDKAVFTQEKRKQTGVFIPSHKLQEMALKRKNWQEEKVYWESQVFFSKEKIEKVNFLQIVRHEQGLICDNPWRKEGAWGGEMETKDVEQKEEVSLEQTDQSIFQGNEEKEVKFLTKDDPFDNDPPIPESESVLSLSFDNDPPIPESESVLSLERSQRQEGVEIEEVKKSMLDLGGVGELNYRRVIDKAYEILKEREVADRIQLIELVKSVEMEIEEDFKEMERIKKEVKKGKVHSHYIACIKDREGLRRGDKTWEEIKIARTWKCKNKKDVEEKLSAELSVSMNNLGKIARDYNERRKKLQEILKAILEIRAVFEERGMGELLFLEQTNQLLQKSYHIDFDPSIEGLVKRINQELKEESSSKVQEIQSLPRLIELYEEQYEKVKRLEEKKVKEEQREGIQEYLEYKEAIEVMTETTTLNNLVIMKEGYKDVWDEFESQLVKDREFEGWIGEWWNNQLEEEVEEDSKLEKVLHRSTEVVVGGLGRRLERYRPSTSVGKVIDAWLNQRDRKYEDLSKELKEQVKKEWIELFLEFVPGQENLVSYDKVKSKFIEFLEKKCQYYVAKGVHKEDYQKEIERELKNMSQISQKIRKELNNEIREEFVSWLDLREEGWLELRKKESRKGEVSLDNEQDRGLFRKFMMDFMQRKVRKEWKAQKKRDLLSIEWMKKNENPRSQSFLDYVKDIEEKLEQEVSMSEEGQVVMAWENFINWLAQKSDFDEKGVGDWCITIGCYNFNFLSAKEKESYRKDCFQGWRFAKKYHGTLAEYLKDYLKEVYEIEIKDLEIKNQDFGVEVLHRLRMREETEYYQGDIRNEEGLNAVVNVFSSEKRLEGEVNVIAKASLLYSKIIEKKEEIGIKESKSKVSKAYQERLKKEYRKTGSNIESLEKHLTDLEEEERTLEKSQLARLGISNFLEAYMEEVNEQSVWKKNQLNYKGFENCVGLGLLGTHWIMVQLATLINRKYHDGESPERLLQRVLFLIKKKFEVMSHPIHLEEKEELSEFIIYIHMKQMMNEEKSFREIFNEYVTLENSQCPWTIEEVLDRVEDDNCNDIEVETNQIFLKKYGIEDVGTTEFLAWVDVLIYYGELLWAKEEERNSKDSLKESVLEKRMTPSHKEREQREKGIDVGVIFDQLKGKKEKMEWPSVQRNGQPPKKDSIGLIKSVSSQMKKETFLGSVLMRCSRFFSEVQDDYLKEFGARDISEPHILVEDNFNEVVMRLVPQSVWEGSLKEIWKYLLKEVQENIDPLVERGLKKGEVEGYMRKKVGVNFLRHKREEGGQLADIAIIRSVCLSLSKACSMLKNYTEKELKEKYSQDGSYIEDVKYFVDQCAPFYGDEKVLLHRVIGTKDQGLKQTWSFIKQLEKVYPCSGGSERVEAEDNKRKKEEWIKTKKERLSHHLLNVDYPIMSDLSMFVTRDQYQDEKDLQKEHNKVKRQQMIERTLNTLLTELEVLDAGKSKENHIQIMWVKNFENAIRSGGNFQSDEVINKQLEEAYLFAFLNYVKKLIRGGYFEALLKEKKRRKQRENTTRLNERLQGRRGAIEDLIKGESGEIIWLEVEDTGIKWWGTLYKEIGKLLGKPHPFARNLDNLISAGQMSVLKDIQGAGSPIGVILDEMVNLVDPKKKEILDRKVLNLKNLSLQLVEFQFQQLAVDRELRQIFSNGNYVKFSEYDALKVLANIRSSDEKVSMKELKECYQKSNTEKSFDEYCSNLRGLLASCMETWRYLRKESFQWASEESLSKELGRQLDKLLSIQTYGSFAVGKALELIYLRDWLGEEEKKESREDFFAGLESINNEQSLRSLKIKNGHYAQEVYQELVDILPKDKEGKVEGGELLSRDERNGMYSKIEQAYWGYYDVMKEGGFTLEATQSVTPSIELFAQLKGWKMEEAIEVMKELKRNNVVTEDGRVDKSKIDFFIHNKREQLLSKMPRQKERIEKMGQQIRLVLSLSLSLSSGQEGEEKSVSSMFREIRENNQKKFEEVKEMLVQSGNRSKLESFMTGRDVELDPQKLMRLNQLVTETLDSFKDLEREVENQDLEGYRIVNKEKRQSLFMRYLTILMTPKVEGKRTEKLNKMVTHSEFWVCDKTKLEELISYIKMFSMEEMNISLVAIANAEEGKYSATHQLTFLKRNTYIEKERRKNYQTSVFESRNKEYAKLREVSDDYRVLTSFILYYCFPFSKKISKGALFDKLKQWSQKTEKERYQTMRDLFSNGQLAQELSKQSGGSNLKERVENVIDELCKEVFEEGQLGSMHAELRKLLNFSEDREIKVEKERVKSELKKNIERITKIILVHQNRYQLISEIEEEENFYGKIGTIFRIKKKKEGESHGKVGTLFRRKQKEENEDKKAERIRVEKEIREHNENLRCDLTKRVEKIKSHYMKRQIDVARRENDKIKNIVEQLDKLDEQESEERSSSSQPKESQSGKKKKASKEERESPAGFQKRVAERVSERRKLENRKKEIEIGKEEDIRWLEGQKQEAIEDEERRYRDYLKDESSLEKEDQSLEESSMELKKAEKVEPEESFIELKKGEKVEKEENLGIIDAVLFKLAFNYDLAVPSSKEACYMNARVDWHEEKESFKKFNWTAFFNRESAVRKQSSWNVSWGEALDLYREQNDFEEVSCYDGKRVVNLEEESDEVRIHIELMIELKKAMQRKECLSSLRNDEDQSLSRDKFDWNQKVNKLKELERGHYEVKSFDEFMVRDEDASVRDIIEGKYQDRIIKVKETLRKVNEQIEFIETLDKANQRVEVCKNYMSVNWHIQQLISHWLIRTEATEKVWTFVKEYKQHKEKVKSDLSKLIQGLGEVQMMKLEQPVVKKEKKEEDKGVLDEKEGEEGGVVLNLREALKKRQQEREEGRIKDLSVIIESLKSYIERINKAYEEETRELEEICQSLEEGSKSLAELVTRLSKNRSEILKGTSEQEDVKRLMDNYLKNQVKASSATGTSENKESQYDEVLMEVKQYVKGLDDQGLIEELMEVLNEKEEENSEKIEENEKNKEHLQNIRERIMSLPKFDLEKSFANMLSIWRSYSYAPSQWGNEEEILELDKKLFERGMYKQKEEKGGFLSAQEVVEWGKKNESESSLNLPLREKVKVAWSGIRKRSA